MTTKYGMFLEHQYLQGGDPARTASPPIADGTGTAGPSDTGSRPVSPGPAAVGAREEGLNFKVTTGRSGKNNDATFGRFLPLNEGDKFIDPARRTLMEAKTLKAGNVVEAPFKGASPMKKSAGLGDYYGTIGGKTEYVPGATLEVQKKKGEVVGQPRGLYTSPAKKGTYGMNKTTLSERKGFKGVATEYEYQHEPSELERLRKLEERAADRKARVTELPFKPSNPPKRGGPGVPNTTISKGKGVAGEWEYITPGALPGEGGEDASKPKTPEITTPFKPASLKSKQIGRIIEYIHDPETPKMEAEAARKKAEHQRLAAAGAWKPSQGPKTDMIRSIVRMNI